MKVTLANAQAFAHSRDMENNYATEEQITEIIQANDDGACLTGGAPIDEIVKEWDGEGLTVEEVEGYIAARVFIGQKAAPLKEAGITPEQAATRTGSDVGIGCYGDTLGYKVANGDLSLEKAKAWLEAGKAAQSLGRLGGKAGTGKAKARTSEQARAAAQARWKRTKTKARALRQNVKTH